jgi:phosphatidylglycerophosphate synthase
MAGERSMEPAIEVVLLAPAVIAQPEVNDSVSVESAGLSQPASARLIAGLRDQGIEPGPVTSITDPDPLSQRAQLIAVLAGPDSADPDRDPLPPIALLAADVVVNATPLGAVLDDPRIRTGALAARVGASIDPDAADRRQLHLGVLRVDGADRRTAADLLAGRPADPEPGGDLLLDLTRALTDAGVEVRPVPLGGYAWARATSADQLAAAVAAVDAVDERTVRLREAARGGDGFYSTFVLRRVSWRFTGIAERIGLTPNQVTLISFGLGLVAAGFLAVGSRPWSVAGALLLQFCLVVDCVDGELARYRRRFSRFGAWLDATTDRIKEFAAIGALAIAAARHDGDLWWLVAAAIALQTFRNLLDLGWALQRAAAQPSGPTTAAGPEWVASATWLRPPVTPSAGAGALSWIRRIGHFPIGERFLLISVGAALGTARGTLVALLVVGLLSAGYMLAAFAVRSRPAGGSGARISGLIDAGPVLGAALRQAIGARVGRLTALLPALIAVAELALIWWLAVEVGGAQASAGAVLVAVTAIAHYQHAYGVREDAAAGPGGFVIGTDLRLVALGLVVVAPALVLTGDDAESWATSAVWALAVLVAISSTVRSLQAWITPDGPNGGAAASPDASIGENGHNEDSKDRMQTVNAETGMTVPRRAIGGVR